MRSRLLFVVALLAITAMVSALVLVANIQNRRADEQTAANKIGLTMTWPDAGPGADPALTLSILTQAAQTTQSNVVRTSVGITASNRTVVTQYVLLEQPTTALFDAYNLSSGRWPDSEELKSASVAVSTTEQAPGVSVIGKPSVLLNAYDITVLGLPAAYETLPAAGKYVIEAPNPASQQQFLDIVAARLTAAGLPVSASDLQSVPSDAALPQESPVNLTGITLLLMVTTFLLALYILLRDGRRIGVLRLNGYSTSRIWFAVVGRLQIIVSIASAVASLAVLSVLPGADGQLRVAALGALTLFSLATLGATIGAATLVVRGVRISNLVKSAPVAGKAALGALLVASTCSGVVLSASLAHLWTERGELTTQRQLASAEEGNRDYAVFYPRLVGDDAVELTSGGNASTISEARELYTLLDSRGALFIDASAYEEVDPQQGLIDQGPFPPPIRVNTNYLQEYPVYDEAGQAISVPPSEEEWVVAVPAKYKADSQMLQDMFQVRRTGNAQRDGAYQGETRIVGAPAERFADQRVRIIWTEPGQQVFTFNPAVAPTDRSMVTDPIIEIMTPSNSLPIDRFNAVTGFLGTALKVKVNGDSARTLTELQPTLQNLRLDDNLRYLVTPDEAALQNLSELEEGLNRTAAVAGASALAVAGFAVAVVLMLADKFNRARAIRRLHGHGILRANREVFLILSASLAAQVILTAVALAIAGPVTADGQGATAPTVILACAAVVAAQAVAILVAITAVERRSLSTGLKEG